MIDLGSTIDVGRAYAQAGYRVLPLWGLTYDPEEGELICQCHRKAECRSAGKHPYEPIAPRGALDASADTALVARWPEGCNVGIVASPTVAGIDIDDSELAEKILAMDNASEMTMVRTRRGVHLYVRCAPAQTQNLKSVDDRHIGEIRVDNALLVLPPSRHLEGTYTWVGPSLLDDKMPETTGTAFEWISNLVLPLGVKLVDRFDPEILALQPDFIDDADLPFAVDPQINLKLYQLLTGTYPTNDRSGVLYLMGCEIWRVAHEKGAELDPAVVAGVMRKVDAVAWHKYTDRDAGRDRRYWETAVKTKAVVESEIATKGSSPSSTAGMRTWTWDSASGFVFQGGQSPRRVCNFEPLIVEVQIVIGEQGELRSDWLVRFTNTDGEIFEHTLRERERGDFRKSMSSVLPPSFVVGAREWSNLEEGMRWYSKDTLRTRRVYGETGWLPDKDGFLLPALGGAITANGIDTSAELSNDNLPPTLSMYGLGMRKPDADFDVAAALRTLYNVASSEVIIPLITQTVAAPLSSLDPSHTATIIHMLSRTGSFKTSIARIAISMYGAFGRGIAPETWTSTSNSLQLAMNEYRDLPMIIDDYKRSLGRAHISQMIALIQNYADRTTRGRITRDQRNQRRVVARCLVISTGEDVWEGQESIMARTVVLDSSRNPTSVDRLKPAQDMAAEGVFAQVGYLWIEWLCATGKDRLRTWLSSKHVEILGRMEKRESQPTVHHARARASLASMLVVDKLWEGFIQNYAPSFLDEFKAMRKEGWETIMNDLSMQTEIATSYSPYEVLREAICTAIATGKGYLAPRNRNFLGIGDQSAPVIGFVDDFWVYLNESVTMGWYLKEEHQKGADAMVSWTSVLQEGRQHHNGRTSELTHISQKGYSSRQRLSSFPRSEYLSSVPEEVLAAAAEPEDDF